MSDEKLTKKHRLFRCHLCSAERTFIPGPTGGGDHPRCDVCGGNLLRVPKTAAERRRAQYEDHLKKCERCSAAIAKPFWTKAGLCAMGRRLMDETRRAGDAELRILDIQVD